MATVGFGAWGKVAEKFESPQKLGESIVTGIINEPAIVPVGGLGKVVFKSITKTAGGSLGKAAVIGGGIIGAALLLGGGQEQTVAPVQDTDVKPQQDTEQKQYAEATARARDIQGRLQARLDARQAITPTLAGGVQEPTYNIRDVSGVVEIGGSSITDIQETSSILYQGISMEQIGALAGILQAQQATPTQTVHVTPQQTTTASQTGSDMLMMVVMLAAVFLLSGGMGNNGK